MYHLEESEYLITVEEACDFGILSKLMKQYWAKTQFDIEPPCWMKPTVN